MDVGKEGDGFSHDDGKALFVYVGEMNNGALNYIPAGALADDLVSFDEDEKTIRFSEEWLMPTSDTGMLVLYEAYNFETMFLQDLVSGKRTVSLEMLPITDFDEYSDTEQPVNNDGRLLLGEQFTIERIDDTEDIQLSHGDETYRIPFDGYKDFIVENDDGLKSRIMFRNFGLWDKSNMRYE